jgi:hypothetical protein
VFVSDGLTENDVLDYARTITNKVSENEAAMHQIRNNSPEQAMLGDIAGALDNAVGRRAPELDEPSPRQQDHRRRLRPRRVRPIGRAEESRPARKGAAKFEGRLTVRVAKSVAVRRTRRTSMATAHNSINMRGIGTNH